MKYAFLKACSSLYCILLIKHFIYLLIYFHHFTAIQRKCLGTEIKLCTFFIIQWLDKFIESKIFIAVSLLRLYLLC